MSSFRDQVLRDIEERSFRAPDIDFDDEKSGAFDALLDRTIARGPGSPIDYVLPYPKHEFLCYLADRRGFLIHGSNNRRIKVFEPRFQADAAGRPAERVYAIYDGVLPMYFAILKRRGYRGTLRNSFTRRAADGDPHPYYFFSVNKQMLERGAWTKGAVYILPSDTFEVTLDRDGNQTEEWSSAVDVQPVAKLHVAPEDFPFLDRVEGHDDTDALRLEELQLRLVRSLERLDDIPGGVCVRFRPRRGVRNDLEELAAILEDTDFLSGVTVRAGVEPEAECLYLAGEGAAELARGFRRFLRPLKIVRRIPGAVRFAAFYLRRR